MITIYAVGHISGDLGPVETNPTFTWRQELRDYFETNSQVHVIDPTNTKFDAQFCKADPESDMRAASYRKKTAAVLLPKSLMSVQRADVIIVDLNLYGSKSHPVGSISELAWAYTMPGKTVIGIYDGAPTKNDLTAHPFVQGYVDIWCKDVKKACQIVDSLFIEPEPSVKSTLTLEDIQELLKEEE